MVAFWVTLFVSSEIGIGTAVAWSLVQFLIRKAFSRVTQVGSSKSELQNALDKSREMPDHIPSDTEVFRMNADLFYPNAHRTKTQIMDVIQ